MRTLTGKKLVIAIDGPAASGKSTTARLVAEKLGYLHLDTGAMYRAVTLKVLRTGTDPYDEMAVENVISATRLELHQQSGSLRVLLDGEDVSEEIRGGEVTQAVSAVSSIRTVREVMVREQRLMGAEGGVVLEGRDIGTVVFPDADLKVFMVAGLESRAQRRQLELERRGIQRDVSKLMRELEERDNLDSTRAASPLRQAKDAIVLDTSGMTIEQQVEFVVTKAEEILRKHA